MEKDCCHIPAVASQKAERENCIVIHGIFCLYWQNVSCVFIKNVEKIKTSLRGYEIIIWLTYSFWKGVVIRMKVAFWSNIRKRGGVSTNMVCIAAVSAIAGIGRSVLLENHYNVNNLNGMLLSQEKIAMLHETGQYYNKYGIEYILKRLYTGTASEQLIRKASIPLLYSSIYYLPQSYILNIEVLE